MPSLRRYEKVTSENCGTKTTKPNLACHKKSCSAGTLYCIQCPNFFTNSQDDLIYHISKRHSAPNPDVTFKCKLCYAQLPSFYALRQLRNSQQGTLIGFGAISINVEEIEGDVDDQSLREELESCKHFLTDTKLENVRHRVFNFAMSSFDKSLLNDKLDYVFKELKCAARGNLAFGFVLKTLRMEFVNTFTLTRTILLWRLRNLCVHQLIWLTWKTECSKWFLLISVPDKEPIQCRIFSN